MDDQYKWRANYTDGTSLRQRDADNTPHAYESIDRDKLASFVLVDQDDTVAFAIQLEPGEGKDLVWTRRTDTKDFVTFKTVHVIGIRGKFVALLFSDGTVVVRHNFVDDPSLGNLFAEVIQNG